MRVLWVIKGLGPGGAERLLCAQARARSRSEFDIECAYVLPYKDHLADELENAGVPTTCLSRLRGDPLWPLRLFELVRSGTWDVIHVHSPLPAAVVRLAVLTMTRDQRPGIVSTEHNRWDTFHPATRLVNELTAPFDDATIAVSDDVAQSMSATMRRRVQVVRHGIDVDAVSDVGRERDVRQRIRDEFGFGASDFVVGTIANFRPQKDYPNLLAAVRLLADDHLPVRVLAVGQGPEEAQTRQLAEELGLGEHVVFTGFRDDAVRVLSACDAFVLASQWEGLPVAVMEACALGLPIVATRVGGLAEEFVDGETALLVPPRDSAALTSAIRRVAHDRELWASLATASTVTAVRFDVRRTEHVLEDIYRRVTRRRTGAMTPTPVARPVSRPPSGDFEMRRATPHDRDAIVDLCRVSLGWDDDPRFTELFAWKHDLNPFGPSLVLVASEQGRLLGVRAFLRWELVRGDEILRVARAVDTATHPDARGRGVFTSLTLEGVDRLRTDGVEFIFNTPNDQSRPGYLNMGWQDVGRIPIAARIIRPDSLPRLVNARASASHWSHDTTVGTAVADCIDQVRDFAERERRGRTRDVRSLTTHTTDEYLSWRYGPAHVGARLVTYGAGAVIVSARQRGDALECALLESLALSPVDADRAAVEAARDMEADYVVRTGEGSVTTGVVPLPGFGPRLTWRAVSGGACPPLSNWLLPFGTVASL